jgi:tetratricopeptide (TPR) repeat protein
MKRIRKAPFTGLLVLLLLATAACSEDATVEIKEMSPLEQHARDYEKAHDNDKKYVELTGNDLDAQQRYASFLFLTKDYQGTVDVLESLDTTTNLSLRLLGMAYLELGEPQKAREYMMRYFAQIQAKEIISPNGGDD